MTTTREHKTVARLDDGTARREFMAGILTDLDVLERMIAENRFETGVRRIGAEQEMFLIDKSWHAAKGSLKMLEQLKDSHFTTELGLFQLEANCDPQEFSGDGISKMEKQLDALMEKVWKAAEDIGLDAVLMGILPTLRKEDLGQDGMVPSERYLTMSKVIADLRGGKFDFSIKGLDELIIHHDSVMLEACNSSFQVHLQVEPKEFARLYNLAQLLAAPMMAISANSPLLFGKRLWAETRIALFRQAVDDRTQRTHHREREARVSFGTRWVKSSVTEIYREDVARFRALVGGQFDEDPKAMFERGEVPNLKSLRLHNGTIYRWNRPCYGVANGKAHLRIENRVMPAGPSVLDEVSNAAFWFGLMAELGSRELDIPKRLEFDQAGANFYAAAREGLGATFTWLDGRDFPAGTLVLEELLPIAEMGLKRQKIDDADIKRYLGTIEQRVKSGRTGARWLLSSWNSLKDKATPGERANAIVAATIQRQRAGRPVHEWERARLDEADASRHNYLRVEQYMTTDLFTVHKDDPVQMVAILMDWERIRHVPVEDNEHKLVGLVSYRSVMRFMINGGNLKTTPVSALMKTDCQTVTPETPTTEAIELMQRYRFGCLPVLSDGKLVGIITEQDFMGIASKLLVKTLGGSQDTK